MIRISVVIPTYNRRAVLERTLAAVLAQEFAADAYEVVVAVDGATDGTVEMLRALKSACALQVLELPNRGAGAARNAAVRAARGELVLFLDDDLMCPPDLLRLHAEAHRDGEASVVHGPIYVAEESAPTMIRAAIEQVYEAYYRPLDPATTLRWPEPIDNAISVVSSLVNSSMPRAALEQCGGFDEKIRASEDLELGIRLWKQGCVFRQLPQAAVRELFVKRSRAYLRGQARAAAIGDLYASRKHPEFRPICRLAALGKTQSWKKLLAKCPASPVPLLAFPLRFERLMYGVKPLRRAGMRLLRLAEQVTVLRTAAKAAGGWAQLESEFGARCPVLLYHHVGPHREGTYRSLSVTAEQFARQMEWLVRHGYTGITPRVWLEWLRTGKGLPKKPVMVTFDDSYADIAEFALPVLHRLGLGGAVYAVTGRLAATNTWDEAEGSGTFALMTAETVREWATKGIEFGGHSRTHAHLPQISAGACREELAGSKSDLEAIIGGEVASFAYPYGQFNESVVEQTRGVYAMAFSTVEGMNTLATDRHLLRRLYVGPSQTLMEFGWNVRRGSRSRWMDDLRVKLGLRTRMKRILGRSR